MLRKIAAVGCMFLLCLLPGCGGKPPLEALAESVAYSVETGELRFTYPKEIPSDRTLHIQVYGRLELEGGGMSWHGFEQESLEQSWVPGETYRATVGPGGIDFLCVEGLLVRDGVDLDSVVVTVSGDGTVRAEYVHPSF